MAWELDKKANVRQERFWRKAKRVNSELKIVREEPRVVEKDGFEFSITPASKVLETEFQTNKRSPIWPGLISSLLGNATSEQRLVACLFWGLSEDRSADE